MQLLKTVIGITLSTLISNTNLTSLPTTQFRIAESKIAIQRGIDSYKASFFHQYDHKSKKTQAKFIYDVIDMYWHVKQFA